MSVETSYEIGQTTVQITKRKGGKTMVKVTGPGQETTIEASSLGEARIISREEAERITEEAGYRRKKKRKPYHKIR